MFVEIQENSKKTNNEEKLIIETTNRTLKVLQQKDIDYIERDLRITKIWIEEEIVETKYKISEIIDKLNQKYFVQCHNSYIVNLNHIKEYDRIHFILNNNKKIPISRSYSKSTKEKIKQWANLQE